MIRPAPTTAMLLAAGLGTRMRPVSNHTPKPLVRVGGKTLLDWALDIAIDAGVTRAVVNVHHLGDQIVAHMNARTTPEIVISDETAQLLDTGGGIVKAMPLLGDEPFVVMNTDGILVASNETPLARLFAHWTDAVDCVMLVHPRAIAHGFDGTGDFFVDADGTMRRRGTAASAPYVYAGAYVIDPKIFANAPQGAFSANKIWDRLLAAGRMKAVIHDGAWFHVGTPDAIAPTEAALAAKGTAQ
ncbi:MAG: nucleotidyltransferase family protein [Rhodobacteraceae bacterium]|nr:nucleotidyltransferase family protein [Paracoccaceae bacterium]